jgi:hypothetical protein
MDINYRFIILPFLFFGCAIFTTREIPEYQISKVDSLLISNSQDIWSTFLTVPAKNQLQFEITVQNIARSGEPVALNLGEASLHIAQSNSGISCISVDGIKDKIFLSSQKSARIICSVSLVANTENQIQNKDGVATVQIPTSGAAIVLTRIVRMETSD